MKKTFVAILIAMCVSGGAFAQDLVKIDANVLVGPVEGIIYGLDENTVEDLSMALPIPFISYEHLSECKEGSRWRTGIGLSTIGVPEIIVLPSLFVTGSTALIFSPEKAKSRHGELKLTGAVGGIFIPFGLIFIPLYNISLELCTVPGKDGLYFGVGPSVTGMLPFCNWNYGGPAGEAFFGIKLSVGWVF